MWDREPGWALRSRSCSQLLEGACLGSREAPRLWLAAQEALEGRGLGPRFLVWWSLAYCLTLLQLPLHEEGLELLLLLRTQVPQLWVFGQDSLELCSKLTHCRHDSNPRQSLPRLGHRSRFGRLLPCIILHGPLEPKGWLGAKKVLGHGSRLVP